MDDAWRASDEKSASSSTTCADFPPSSRLSRLRVGADFSMIRRPVAVEPVNEIMSTRRSSDSSSPTSGSDEVTTLSTPGGRSVFSATMRAMRVAFHGVSGAGFSTTVHPVASAGAILCRISDSG